MLKCSIDSLAGAVKFLHTSGKKNFIIERYEIKTTGVENQTYLLP